MNDKIIIVGCKGKIAVEILMMMVIIVTISAIILLLVSMGIITVKKNIQTQSVLNTEFLPLERSGHLAIKNFEFCSFVDDDFGCEEVKEEFKKNDNVYVRFLVESSTYNGDVKLIRNYQIENPEGEIVLEAEQKNNYFFDIKSNERTEPVIFSDYFVLGEDDLLGEYTLKIIVNNPLLEKEVSVNKKFRVVE